MAMHFLQQCPTCGRSLQVRVQYLGKLVACQHCHGKFLARNADVVAGRLSDSSLDLLRRADELLDRAGEIPPPNGPTTGWSGVDPAV